MNRWHFWVIIVNLNPLKLQELKATGLNDQQVESLVYGTEFMRSMALITTTFGILRPKYLKVIEYEQGLTGSRRKEALRLADRETMDEAIPRLFESSPGLEFDHDAWEIYRDLV